MRPTFLAALLLLPLAQGCFMTRDTVNQPLREERIAELSPGMTSEQVLALLGAPMEVVQLGRRSAWRYDHQVTKRTGLFVVVATALNTDAQEDRLWLFFNELDTLAAYGATLQADEAKWRLPWAEPVAR